MADEYDAVRARLRDLVNECGLSRAEAKLFDEALVDLDIAVEDKRKAPTVTGSDETFFALSSAFSLLKRDVIERVVTAHDANPILQQSERCFQAALEHATSARARRGESAWEVAARAVADRQTPPAGTPVAPTCGYCGTPQTGNEPSCDCDLFGHRAPTLAGAPVAQLIESCGPSCLLPANHDGSCAIVARAKHPCGCTVATHRWEGFCPFVAPEMRAAHAEHKGYATGVVQLDLSDVEEVP